ncbi:unnamed protein product, partial [Staurois parvus]
MRGPGRADIVNAGSQESRYSECGVSGYTDIVNAGSGESGYSECGVRGGKPTLLRRWGRTWGP